MTKGLVDEIKTYEDIVLGILKEHNQQVELLHVKYTGTESTLVVFAILISVSVGDKDPYSSMFNNSASNSGTVMDQLISQCARMFMTYLLKHASHLDISADQGATPLVYCKSVE